MSSVAQELGLSESEARQAMGDYLNYHVIVIFTYGLYTMLFAGTLKQIVSRGEWPRQRTILAILISLIWSVATVYTGLYWQGLYTTYVTHGQSEDSILGYLFEDGPENFSRKRLAINVTAYTAIAVNAMIAEVINIWRCWELYNRNWFVATVPLLGVICGLIAHALMMAATFPSGEITAQWFAINWTIIYYSVTAAVNVLTTSLIILRILTIGGLKSARTYRGLIEILIESALLYSVVYIIYLALYVRDFYTPSLATANWYAGSFLNTVTAAAPTMIIGRVMAGEARPNDSWTRSSLPRMQTGMRSLAESLRFTSFRPARTQNTTTTADLPSHGLASEFKETASTLSAGHGQRSMHMNEVWADTRGVENYEVTGLGTEVDVEKAGVRLDS
ncbi:hypothetical protein BDZ89DRAFT_1058124 [Hymenopellis radicata]|nr:hypothetical protein BDZ89DRAFT_1058124 [Hymenopellis radicata]